MRKRNDVWIFLIVLILFAIGYLLVLSASSYSALNTYNDSFKFSNRHLIYIALSSVTLLIFWIINYRIYDNKYFITCITSIAIFLSIVTLIFGTDVNGAVRWIKIGKFTFMPVETAKIAIIFSLSYTLSRFKPKKNKFLALVAHFLITFIFMLLTYLQPDTSSSIILFMIFVGIMFVGFEPLWYLIVSASVMVVPITLLILSGAYRVGRLESLKNGLQDVTKAADQIKYGILAVSSGGFFGVGVGRSIFNKLYIPHAHNDIIFSTLGEEYGFIGVVVILTLYLILVSNIISVAIQSKNQFSKMLCFGVAVTISMQILINIGTTIGIMPPTGIPLPFVSYGGTNMLVLAMLIGVVLSVYRMEVYK